MQRTKYDDNNVHITMQRHTGYEIIKNPMFKDTPKNEQNYI